MPFVDAARLVSVCFTVALAVAIGMGAGGHIASAGFPVSDGERSAGGQSAAIRLAQNSTDGSGGPANAGSQTGETRPEKYTGFWWSIQEWLARANREYQDRLVKGLSVPAETDVAKPAPEAEPASDAIAEKIAETETEPAADQAEDASPREAARVAAPDAEAEQQAARDAARKAAAAEQAAAQRKAEQEERQRAEAQRRADAQRKAEAARQAAEQEKRAEAARVARERARLEAEKQAAETRMAAERARRERAEVEASSGTLNRRSFTIVTEPIPARETVRQRRAARSDVVFRPEPVARPSPRWRPEPVADARPSSRTAGYARYASDPPRRTARRAGKKRHRRVAAAGRCHGAGRRVHPPGRYVVRPGDSLWRISRRHYRKGRHYRAIYRANRHKIRNPDLIYPCQRLKVPRRRR